MCTLFTAEAVAQGRHAVPRIKYVPCAPSLTLVVLRSPLGDKLLEIGLVCPQILKGLTRCSRGNRGRNSSAVHYVRGCRYTYLGGRVTTVSTCRPGLIPRRFRRGGISHRSVSRAKRAAGGVTCTIEI